MSTPQTNWPASLTRLDTIRRTDPGLYAVALHAFIEGEAGRALESTRDMNFRQIIQAWWREHRLPHETSACLHWSSA